MLHGYCIRFASDPAPSDGLAGVDGHPVRRLEEGGLQLWLSDDSGHPATVERLRQHERVVREALRSATPLPLRYGSRFVSESEARAALAERDREFTKSLHRVHGRLEMSVRVAEADPGFAKAPREPDERIPASAGREYLERRRAELRAATEARGRAESILAELMAELSDLDLPTARSVLPGGGLLGSLAHLVHKGGLRPYRQRIVELGAAHPELRISLSGPWAPYSFV